MDFEHVVHFSNYGLLKQAHNVLYNQLLLKLTILVKVLKWISRQEQYTILLLDR